MRPRIALLLVLALVAGCRRYDHVEQRPAVRNAPARLYRHLASAPPPQQPSPAAFGPAPAGKAPLPGPEGPAFIGTMSRASAPGEADARPEGPASLGTQGRLPTDLTDPAALARQSAQANWRARIGPAEYCRQQLLENRPLGGTCSRVLGRQGAAS
jgi:hypothetical protein